MKPILCVLVLAATPAALSAAIQAPERGETLESAGDSARSQSSRLTSHDRHTRRHRRTSQHHRRRTPAKANTH